MADLLLQAIIQGLLVGATDGLVALGMGIIYSVSGVINFSHGDFVTAPRPYVWPQAPC
jgi:branched-chain amino acid transport system permease protein